MSQYHEETADHYHEQQRRARKTHRCSACREAIRPLDTYTRVSIIFDGTVRSLKRCARCQAIHLHLRDRCEESKEQDRWPDEWLHCGRTYEEEWGECPPEIARLAFALPGEV